MTAPDPLLGASDPNSLLAPNAKRLTRALEVIARKIEEIPTDLTVLADPERCPARFLPWLAFEQSVDSWKPDWSEAVKRSLIAASIGIHRRKGSAKSVRDVVRAFGGDVAIREWWQLEPRGEPHTFDIVITLTGQDGAPATAAFVEEVIDEVARTKPARSWFTATQGIRAESCLAIAAAARVANYRRLQLEAA